jgi:hypothetical protein
VAAQFTASYRFLPPRSAFCIAMPASAETRRPDAYHPQNGPLINKQRRREGASFTGKHTMSLTARRPAPIGIRAYTGQRCPQTGVWRRECHPTTTVSIIMGTKMPAFEGRIISWVLIRYA